MSRENLSKGFVSGAFDAVGAGEARGSERLFIALSIPDSVRLQLTALAEPHHGVTWVPAENLHLTLRFLGEVAADQMGALEQKLGGVSVEPFIIPVEGLGAFPPKGPSRVLWAGVGAGHPHLFQLRQRLDDAVLAAGVDLDVRTFLPHVTLARCTEGAAEAAAGWLRHNRDFAAAPFRVKTFDLYESRLAATGVEYRLKRRYALA